MLRINTIIFRVSTTEILAAEPNPNHPRLGDTIKVEPIRTVNAINTIEKNLAPSPRNLALFVVGINTAYRASELISIQLKQVRHLAPDDRLEIKQKRVPACRSSTITDTATARKILLASIAAIPSMVGGHRYIRSRPISIQKNCLSKMRFRNPLEIPGRCISTASDSPIGWSARVENSGWISI